MTCFISGRLALVNRRRSNHVLEYMGRRDLIHRTAFSFYLLPGVVQNIRNFRIHVRIFQLLFLYKKRFSFLLPMVGKDLKYITIMHILGANFDSIPHTFTGIFVCTITMRYFYINHGFSCGPINSIPHQSFQRRKVFPGIAIHRTILDIVRNVILRSNGKNYNRKNEKYFGFQKQLSDYGFRNETLTRQAKVDSCSSDSVDVGSSPQSSTSRSSQKPELVEREFSVLVDPKPLKKKIRSIEVL